LEPLPYEAPEEVHVDELEVVDEEDVSLETEKKLDTNEQTSEDMDTDKLDDKGQTKLF
jgi:topoisomerase-4 subunit A